jgi:hypothetical protein
MGNFSFFEKPSEAPLCIDGPPSIIVASQEIKSGTSKFLDAAFNSTEEA